MARRTSRSFVASARRTVVGAAKKAADRAQRVALKAATAAARAAAEAAVAQVMKSLMGPQSNRQDRKTAAKRIVRGAARRKAAGRKKRA
ncbi:MAG: hypothetical protein JO205_10680 [Pseudolabrys sp.]|nr:hypothetical protein [Pseudolabrys sp.]MBV9261825.1 hypothetical protein [Pseudolabrys sp.]